MVETDVKIDKDLEKRKITISKHFNAKPDVVWQAWTRKEILDQWWAPKPWRAETKKLELHEGGSWQYAMVGPEDERHHGKFQYTKINAMKSLEGIDSFTDEKGFVDTELPQATWKIEFRSAGAGTDVRITVSGKSQEVLEQLLASGFEEGFRMALGNLDERFENEQT